MKKIFVFTNYYLPGYTSGGAMRTVANMVERLGDRYDFRIITRGYDVGETSTYPGLNINGWNQIGKAVVYHAGHGELTFGLIRRLVKEVSPDAIYLTSFFATLAVRFLTLRRLGMIPDIPVILAPEGEFSTGALQLKGMKKKIFRSLAFPGKLYDDLIWKAASEPERIDIQRVAGAGCEIYVAPNMPPRMILADYSFDKKPRKKPGETRLVFLSRIMPKKNVKHCLESLMDVEGKVTFDIFGPIEDESYWRECQEVISRLPSNIKVTHQGSVDHNDAAKRMIDYHFFLLPTLGENFGHVMLEAFSAGCPVVISDQTPWRDLVEKQIGWDLPLANMSLWREALQKCVSMDAVEYQKQSMAARQYAIDWLSAPEMVEATSLVLDRALAQKRTIVSSAA